MLKLFTLRHEALTHARNKPSIWLIYTKQCTLDSLVFMFLLSSFFLLQKIQNTFQELIYKMFPDYSKSFLQTVVTRILSSTELRNLLYILFLLCISYFFQSQFHLFQTVNVSVWSETLHTLTVVSFPSEDLKTDVSHPRPPSESC